MSAVRTHEARHLLRSPVGLARAVVALLCTAVVADVLDLAAALHLRGEFADAVDYDAMAYSSTELFHADLLYQRSGSLRVLALLATAVLFIIWFRRVRINAGVFDASLQPMKTGWAIGAWFVPIANLWLPRRIAAGVWAASARIDADGRWRTESTVPLNLWWTAWVLTAVFERYAQGQYARADLRQEIMDALALGIAADLLDTIAAVLAILFVRKLTRMQGERAALGANPYAAPAPTGPVQS